MSKNLSNEKKMRILPTTTYQIQNQNHKKQILNFGMFKLIDLNGENPQKIVEKFNDLLLKHNEMAIPICSNNLFYIQTEFDIFMRLNKKGKDCFFNILQKSTKKLSPEDLDNLGQQIENDPNNAKQIICKGLSVSEKNLKKLEKLIKKRTSLLNGLFSNGKSKFNSNVKKNTKK